MLLLCILALLGILLSSFHFDIVSSARLGDGANHAETLQYFPKHHVFAV